MYCPHFVVIKIPDFEGPDFDVTRVVTTSCKWHEVSNGREIAENGNSNPTYHTVVVGVSE